jgi:hypothetical protein
MMIRNGGNVSDSSNTRLMTRLRLRPPQSPASAGTRVVTGMKPLQMRAEPRIRHPYQIPMELLLTRARLAAPDRQHSLPFGIEGKRNPQFAIRRQEV